jgi:hypothetical protein
MLHSILAAGLDDSQLSSPSPPGAVLRPAPLQLPSQYKSCPSHTLHKSWARRRSGPVVRHLASLVLTVCREIYPLASPSCHPFPLPPPHRRTTLTLSLPSSNCYTSPSRLNARNSPPPSPAIFCFFCIILLSEVKFYPQVGSLEPGFMACYFENSWLNRSSSEGRVPGTAAKHLTAVPGALPSLMWLSREFSLLHIMGVGIRDQERGGGGIFYTTDPGQNLVPGHFLDACILPMPPVG